MRCAVDAYVAIDWALEYMKLRALWRRSPVLYANQRLGLNLTWQQAQLLNAIAKPEARVSVRSGHSTGKSAAMATAIWWKLECFDGSEFLYGPICCAATRYSLG